MPSRGWISSRKPKRRKWQVSPSDSYKAAPPRSVAVAGQPPLSSIFCENSSRFRSTPTFTEVRWAMVTPSCRNIE
jgi:hypothetical protein